MAASAAAKRKVEELTAARHEAVDFYKRIVRRKEGPGAWTVNGEESSSEGSTPGSMGDFINDGDLDYMSTDDEAFMTPPRRLRAIKPPNAPAARRVRRFRLVIDDDGEELASPAGQVRWGSGHNMGVGHH